MKHVLMTSMLAIGLGCGTAMAQTRQPPESQSGADTNCASGTTNCQNGSKMKDQAQGTKSQTDQQAQGKAKMKTDEQAQGKAKVQTDQQAQGKAGTKTDEQAQGKAKVQTDQQAQGKAGATTDQQAQGKAKVQTDQQAQGKAGATTDQQAQGKAKVQTDQQAQGKASTQDKTSTASISNVTVEQKTQITQVFRETKVEPVASVNFDVSVGIEVPRHKIRLHRLPARIVKIVPAYEAYEYFVLADGRIVIVDPDTYKIVLILT
ncbi:DUF1236 domain-containing protein [Mesorhizobium sp. M8A.F.Ca.ET.208.01.1.1]|uniref:DUF1236 domain-containing protein n=1 Tax=unclassified Mesorhizobium TaxID=325217 RepID=UPI0010935E8D|nr:MULTISPECIES: DUF1236 domain-containing protein [unclassified Mesorhizobium]TGQ87812.1 DUF1236 domain-containing protein [Mesorhizobium sp. M8A.F.Ca.ET.208.01.1.1]TGT49542.1 DUF1236 domain-containing protein [Mesorhizobium sp. M8A.F.Ca.ET.167.01.1.1]